MKAKSSAVLIVILYSIIFMISPISAYGTSPVEMQVIHFDENETFTYTFSDGFSVEMKGRAIVRYTVHSPDLTVVVEQTPDLKNWVAQEPLSVEVVASDETSTTYEATFQIHCHPNTGDDKSQYFRLNY